MAIHIKAFEQCFPVVLFIVLQKVVLLLSVWIKSLSVTIQLKASKHSHVSCVTFYYAVQGGSNFLVC